MHHFHPSFLLIIPCPCLYCPPLTVSLISIEELFIALRAQVNAQRRTKDKRPVKLRDRICSCTVLFQIHNWAHSPGPLDLSLSRTRLSRVCDWDCHAYTTRQAKPSSAQRHDEPKSSDWHPQLVSLRLGNLKNREIKLPVCRSSGSTTTLPLYGGPHLCLGPVGGVGKLKLVLDPWTRDASSPRQENNPHHPAPPP